MKPSVSGIEFTIQDAYLHSESRTHVDSILYFFYTQKKLTRKENRFNGHIPELTQHTTDASNEGRRSATIIPRDEVNLTRKIGEGAHGSVHEGSWADVHGAVSAVVFKGYSYSDGMYTKFQNSKM